MIIRITIVKITSQNNHTNYCLKCIYYKIIIQITAVNVSIIKRSHDVLA